VKSIAVRGGFRVEVGGESLISSAGGSLLLQTAAVSGLAAGLSRALGRWRPARSVHDPGKTVQDLAVAIALGGDCLADVAVLRAQPGLFGAVASDPTVSRLMDSLGEDAVASVAALRSARAGARERVWGHRCPVAADGPVIIDVDATLVESHSEKQGASAHRKHGFGFHPLLAFVDHGGGGTGEPLVGMLRPGRAAANTAADHIALLDAALAQLPEQLRSRVLVRGDAGAGVHEFVWHIHNLGLHYSVGVNSRQPILDALAAVPRRAWRAAREPDGRPRDGVQVAELTGRIPASTRGWPWPPGTRIIARRERPHPGAQLHITDHDGWRITVFATNTSGRLVDLDLRHRLRARAEDRIRGLKDTGLTNLPLQAFAKNQIWLELVQLAAELLTWTQLLAWHHHPARSWEPKRLRLRLLSVAARLITTGRRRILRISRQWPWSDLITNGHQRLAALT
jgi:Transposase DDE domain group 1